MLLRAYRLFSVKTTESLKIVFEKTELKVNEESKSNSCAGDLGQSGGRMSVGSLGGFSGGIG